MSEIKRCPFCGGEALIHQNKDEMKTYSVYCGNEDCPASPKISCYGKEMAIDLWNTRKSMERIVERLEMKQPTSWEYDAYWNGVKETLEEAIEIVKEEGGIE